MRHLSFAATGFMLAILLLPPTAHGAGNVLLPSATDSNGQPSLPNLGIGVPSSSAGMANSSLPIQAPVSPPPARATQAMAPVSTPQISTPATQTNNPITTLDPTIAAKLPRGTMPTTIIHQPDTSASLAQAGRNLPNSLMIAIGGSSLFGAADVKNISKELGLSRDQISSACLLTVGGLMQTDKNSYILDGGASTQYTVRYEGMIQNYLLVGNALCTANNIPPGSGFLAEMGGRYIIPLKQIKCPPPTRQVSSLTITYDGSGTSKCAYQ
jgi:hypothetical protein